MTTPETISAVTQVHSKSRSKTHYSDPTALADALIGDRSSPQYEDVRRATLREPTEPHVFPSTHETIRALLQDGDSVVIWTQGWPRNQLWKVATSGLGHIRHELPKQQRHRFSVCAGEDKLSLLPKLLEKSDPAAPLLLVDDKKEILVATQEAMQARPSVEAYYIHTKQKSTGGENEEDALSTPHPIHTITDISQLRTMKEALRINGPVQWYIDLGNTLVDSKSLRQATDASYAAIVEQREPTITHAIDLLAGLPGHVARTQEFATEDRRKHVVDVTAPDGSELVIKSSHLPERIRAEIAGYSLLKDSPLAAHILSPYASSQDPAFLVLPKIEGIQMREGVRKEEFPHDMALGVLEELLDIKKQWWSMQEKQKPETFEIVSNQRRNWSQNLERIATVIAQMSQSTDIPIEAFFSSPIISSGKRLPPLRDSLLLIHALLKQPPPYTLLTHGDAMGGNILVEKDTGNWHLLDPEYAGYNDPAEAYVKTIKYVTTATAQGMNRFAATQDGDVLFLDLQVKFPSLACKLQEYGLSRVEEFAKALDDPDFPNRVDLYVTASYLREIALTIRRERPEMAWFALLKAQENTAKLLGV